VVVAGPGPDHWASGIRPEPVISKPSKNRATAGRSRGVIVSDAVALYLRAIAAAVSAPMSLAA
jgi:hypothetical protein